METGVGFVGIGSMGSGMAANLVTAGHRVVVWNRTRERAEGVLWRRGGIDSGGACPGVPAW